MPSAPLYYAPYMKALYSSTQIGNKGATVESLRDEQLTYDVQLDPTGMPTGATPASKAAAAFDKDHADQSNKLGDSVIAGMAKMQQSMHAADPGGKWTAAPIARYQFSTSLEGAIAGRMDTALRTNPTMLDSLTPEDAVQLGKNVRDGSQKDLETHDVRFSGDTMDVGPQSMARLMQSTSGKALGVQDAFAVAEQMSREVQRTVTPTDPAKAGGPNGWIDEATNIIAAHWPGAVAKVAESMQISKDYAQLEDLGKQARMADEMSGPQATYVRSLKSLLSAAGVDVEKADAAPAAFQLLQAKPQDQVPTGIVQAILAKAKLPVEATDYFTKRLADTGGQDGNVQGLLDSIELARRDAEAKQPPKTDPGKTDPGKTDPGKTDPGKTDPGKTDPGKTDPGKPPVDPGKPPVDPGKPPVDPGKTDPGKSDPGKTDPGKPPVDPGKPPVDGDKKPAGQIPNPADPLGGNPGTPGVPAGLDQAPIEQAPMEQAPQDQ